jgi:hypothetical protein
VTILEVLLEIANTIVEIAMAFPQESSQCESIHGEAIVYSPNVSHEIVAHYHEVMVISYRTTSYLWITKLNTFFGC